MIHNKKIEDMTGEEIDHLHSLARVRTEIRKAEYYNYKAGWYAVITLTVAAIMLTIVAYGLVFLLADIGEFLGLV